MSRDDVVRARTGVREPALTGGGNATGVVTSDAPAEGFVRFRVADMDCPSCVARIRTHLLTVDGVQEVDGSPVQRTLSVRFGPERTGAEPIRREVARLGYTAQPETPDRTAAAPHPPTWSSRQARIAYASMGLFALAWLLRLAGAEPLIVSLPLADVLLPDLLFVASALVGGWNFFPKGLRAARSLALDMNFLMTAAIIGALAIGEYVEAAAIAFLFALAELLESYAVDRARHSVDALMKLAPDTARVRRGAAEVSVPASELVPGDVFVVRPGDRLPADGVVVEGVSAVDQSPVTGESVPVEKQEGSDVFSGTINREGFLAVRVSRPAGESTLARIVRLVEEAEGLKTRTERFVERFARWYTPAVTVAAVLTVLVPVALFGAPFVTWFVRGLTLLVIACPCALVISTPVAVVSGVTAAARHGVLIKGGTYLEALAGVKVLALDKTGTLTFGQPEVTDVRPAAGVDEADLLRWAAAVESRSEHPVARAIVEHAGPAPAAAPASPCCGDAACGAVATAESDRPQVSDFAAEPGRGARARVDGVEYVVGKPSFAAPGTAVPADLAGAGRTVVAVASQGRILGWIAVSDRAREAAAESIAQLRKAGITRVVMLTGDAAEVGELIGQQVGVDEVRAGLLPGDKVEVVKDLERRHGGVAMVGDGVNDAPALAAATVGIVMGAAGSDAALETADIALMGDDLTRLPYVRSLSQAASQVIRTNIAAALLVKAVLVVGVPFGWVSLITAVVVGDMGVSLAVTLNALRLGRVEAAS